MRRHYPLLLFVAIMAALPGCQSVAQLVQPPATEVPFARFTAEDVIAAFSQAGLTVEGVSRDMLIGRGAPNSFSDRYIFEVPRIAPAGGQFMIFATPGEMDEWLAYVERLRANSDTRREVAHVYRLANVLLQVNANLLPEEAGAFEAALMAMGE